MTLSWAAEATTLGTPDTLSNSRLGMLVVSKRLPRPTADHAGGQITHFYLDDAVRWADIDLIALATQGENEEGVAAVRSLEIIECPLDGTDASSPRGMRLRAEGYLRLLRSAVAHCRSKSYDLIILERSALGWMAPILARFASAPIVLVAHDLWFDRLDSERHSSKFPKSLYFGLLKSVAIRMERLGVSRSAGIICYDPRTKTLIRERLVGPGRESPPVEVLPPQHRVWDAGRSQPRQASICFYGNMARSANWRSAIWFIEDIFPRVKARIPEATFHVVGANPPEPLRSHHDGKSVFVTGFLASPDPILASAEVFVAPIVTGTGIKIKVLEAMASGIPVVGNAIAMQGIPAIPDQDYLHAEDAQMFADQLVRVLTDRDLRDRIALNGRRLRQTSLDPEQGRVRNREFLERIANSSH